MGCALARREAETDGTKHVRHVLKEIRGVEAGWEVYSLSMALLGVLQYDHIV